MFIDYYERKVSTPSDRVAFDKFVRQIQELKKEELNWDIIKDSVIDVYCEKFTQKEIEEMLAFYTSETGKAMMEKLPNAMSDARKFSSKAIHSFMPKVFEIEQELKDTLEDSSVSE
ncbi:MAG: hypothetical protein CMD81_02280 [Gammaproteobacteria bacterium]|mgnify:FL=1|nr:hypothetical protein [Gammaproteobacteria bacterium]|tara:strand:+ start:58 stop:405 length:348 start_codon:yes stop_codon:yes gene_type:complete